MLINNKHEAVLTDFGLSKVVEKLSRSAGSSTSTGAGALRWKAPELLRGGKVTLASDIWAFGCTSFEVLFTFHIWSFAYHPTAFDGGDTLLIP